MLSHNKERSQGQQRQNHPPYQQRLDNRWSEEKAESVLRDSFGFDYSKTILTVDIVGYNTHIEKVKNYIKNNRRAISTSQLRNVFSCIQGTKDYKELARLRPKLAYVSGRSDANEMKTLVFLLDRLIVAVDDPSKLVRLRDFMESLVAYHKYFGGKN